MDHAHHLYAIALGSNRRHGRFGDPRRVVGAAIQRLECDFSLFAASSIIRSRAVGGGGREFANAVALIVSPLDPPALLAEIKAIERDFGRRRGRRWGARVLDLDILLWSGGHWERRGLTIPHRSLASRPFVLGPLAQVAPRLRITGSLTASHLAHRLTSRGAPHPPALLTRSCGGRWARAGP